MIDQRRILTYSSYLRMEVFPLWALPIRRTFFFAISLIKGTTKAKGMDFDWQ
jgi:hypothetical protein